FTVNLLSVSYGASFGWISACYRQLLHPETTHFDRSKHLLNEHGFLISSLTFGVLIGVVLFGWLAERIGRRGCLLLMVIPAVLKWLLIIYARHNYHLYIERVIAGTVGGCCFAVIPIYITEMTEDRHRSTLGTFMPLSMLIGMLHIHILGYFLHYVTAAFIMLLIPLAFLCSFIFIPDSPEYLERYHKKGVEQSVSYFRGIATSENAELQVELTKLRQPFHTLESGDQRVDNNLRLSDFTNKKALKVLFIGLGILSAKQLTGYLRMVNQSISVFANLSAIEGSITVIIIQLVGSFTATLLVEKVGRKILLLISSAGICLGQVLMAACLHFDLPLSDVISFEWFLILCFSLVMYSGAIGVTAVDFVVTTEIAPPKIRSVMVRVQMVIFVWISLYFTKSIPLWFKLTGIPGGILTFAFFSFLFTIFIALYVPETKGKSIEAIQTSL
ncbi:hypothetical protein KR044_005134, partial [Drosophila immigrans]